MASDRDLAERAVRAGAAAAQRLAGSDLDVRSKSSAADLVSAADHASEEAIVELLLGASNVAGSAPEASEPVPTA